MLFDTFDTSVADWQWCEIPNELELWASEQIIYSEPVALPIVCFISTRIPLRITSSYLVDLFPVVSPVWAHAPPIDASYFAVLHSGTSVYNRVPVFV